jgi:GTP-binding protein HflX
VVGIVLPGKPHPLAEEHLDELVELARTAGVEVVGRHLQARPAPEPGTFIGRGKAEAIAEEIGREAVDLVIFDDDLAPGQVKNLEKIFQRQVMDRSGLILEIFHQRARSREARTQVDLAQLEYLLPRLTGMWRHLERQEGGIGVRGGAGETQLEADRRMLRRRIASLKQELARIERSRRTQRSSRRGGAVQVALAGYTNAGKSTLFNRLTDAGALAENKLFATLDAKLRRGALGADGATVVFADTVGFIRKLPHHLVASFRSTLEEVTDADLVLHVIDRSHPQWHEQKEVAEGVLAELGVAPERVLVVFNKVDRLGDDGPLGAVGDAVAVSALSGAGLPELRAAIRARLTTLGRAPRPAGGVTDDSATAQGATAEA